MNDQQSEALPVLRTQEWSDDMDDCEDDIDVTELLRKLVLRWKTVARIMLAFTAAGLIIALLLRPYYRASASFIPPANGTNSNIAGVLGQIGLLPIGTPSLKSPGDLYVGVMKSRTVLSRLVERFHLRETYKVSRESDAEKILSNHTSFNVGSKDPIVSLEVEDGDPTRARDLANAYLDELTRASSELALTEASQKRLFFGEQLTREKDALADAEVQLKEAQEKTGLVAPAGQVSAEFEVMAQLRAQVASREVQLAALRQSATEQNPDVIRLHSEITNLQSQLARMQKGAKSSPGNVPVGRMPEAEIELIRKQREVKFHEALMEILAKQYESARMDEAQSTPILQILDRATLPEKKAGPKRLYITAGSLVFGFLAGVFWVLLSHPLTHLWQSLKPATNQD